MHLLLLAALFGAQALPLGAALRPSSRAPLLPGRPAAPPMPLWEQPQDWGLLTLGTQAPLFVNRLHFLPGRLMPLRARQIELAVALNHVNIWAQMPGYFFDGEWTQVQLRVGVGLGWGSELALEVPAYARSGGFLDGFIMGFHDMFNLTQSRRDRYPRNRLQVETRAAEGFITRLSDRDAGAGLGNPVLRFRQLLGRQPPRPGAGPRPATALVAELALKLPVGSIAQQYATDGLALLLALGAQQSLSARLTLYAHGGMVWAPGAKQVYTIALTPRQKFLVLGVGLTLTDRLRVVLQVLNQDGMARSALFRPLCHTTYEFGVGLQIQPRLLGNWLMEVGIIENGIHDANTPDFGVHFALRHHST